MVSGLRWYFVSSAVLGALAMLAGCSGFPFAEREAWRREAEVECLSAGLVKEGPGVVRISPIRGPGVCGAEYPLRVSVLGESAPLAFDDPRPPAAIPSGPPNWPVRSRNAAASPAYPDSSGARYDGPNASGQPISLNPPGLNDGSGGQMEDYNFRAPYGGSRPARPKYQPPAQTGSPREDLSPVPYERRRLVEGDDVPARRPGAISRAPLPEYAPAPRVPAHEEWRDEPVRRPVIPPLPPLGSGTSAQPAQWVAPVSVNPPATLACPIVSELDRWITGAVQPAALRWFGSPVAEIKQISAYSCRGMNGNPYARISEHAFGNALDIAAFTLADGRTVTVKNGWHGLPEEQGFLRDVQGAACNQFTTVLAPGSNVYHYDHIHVDLMRHGSGHHTCSPNAVSGEEVAGRAGARYARRASGPGVTGSVPTRRPPRPPQRRHDGGEELRDRALPLAQPGADGDE
jgi:hypothetical protein